MPEDTGTTSGTQSPHVELDGFKFAMIPEGVLYGDLSHVAVRVYGALLRHGTDPGSCFPSHDRLGRLVGCSRDTAKRAVSELRAAGWVTVVERCRGDGGQTSNGYRIHDTPRGTHAPGARGTHAPGPGAPMPHEREPLNESHLNESVAAHESSSSPRARHTPDDDDGGKLRNVDNHALAELEAAALARGWPREHLTAVRVKAQAARSPVAYYVTSLADLAGRDAPAPLDLEFDGLAAGLADRYRLT